MPDTPAAGSARPRANEQEESTTKKMWGMAQQFLLIWVVMQLATRYFTKPQPETVVVPEGQISGTGRAAMSDLPTQGVLGWPLGIPLSLHVYLTTSDVPSARESNEGLPSFVWEGIKFGDWKESRVIDFNVPIPKSVQNNGSLWADIFLIRGDTAPILKNPNSKFDPASVHHVRKSLTYYLPKIKVRKVKNLLGGRIDDNPEEDDIVEADEILSHWHRNLTLALVSEASIVDVTNLAEPAAEYIKVVPGVRDASGTKAIYQPIIFANEFWNLRSQFIEINSTTPSLPLQVVFQPMSYLKFQLFSSMTVGFKQAAQQQGGSGGELDEVKRMLVETNPYFLATTAIVTVLHMLFEILAFKNDVSHWRQKSEMVGVSVRTIVLNVFIQTIILLYLVDNNEQTSWMILFSSGMGVLIEAWKITKAVDTVFIPTPGSLLPYRVEFRDKHVLSEDEKKTQEYDKLAFRYVSYVTVPLLAGYTVYSLMYETHRGWYSFIISTLTSFVYMFGFAQLIPQLIINYKLKSVAHMPMKAMIYKTLSTVVDDFFAFCIKMPILHRLACFRDDVVFLIFLYQRWIYRIDPKRINEYGQVMATDVISADAKSGSETSVNKETKKNQ